MTNAWDEYAQAWDNNPDVKAYAEQAFKELLKQCDITNKTILDFGCGTGTFTALLSAQTNKIVALDDSPKMIAQLERKNLANVVTHNDLLTADFINQHSELINSFDIIVASSVCGFLPNYPETLLLLKSLLKEQGTFVQWDWLSEEMSEKDDKVGLSFNEVEQALTQCQFTDIHLTTPFKMNSSQGITPVLMAVARNN